MKFLVPVLIFSLFLAACGRIEHFQNLSQQKIEPDQWETGEIEQPAKPPVLSILQDVRGTQRVVGKSLFFNFYDNGVIEFDYYDDQKMTSGKDQYNAQELNTLRRARITPEELKKFFDLLKSDDFQKAKSKYDTICPVTDSSWILQISFRNAGQEKNIELVNYCVTARAADSNFPKVLNDLINLIWQMHAKYKPEKSSNQAK